MSYNKYENSELDKINKKIKELSNVIDHCNEGNLKNALISDLRKYKSRAQKYKKNSKKYSKDSNNYISTYSNNKNSYLKSKEIKSSKKGLLELYNNHVKENIDNSNNSNITEIKDSLIKCNEILYILKKINNTSNNNEIKNIKKKTRELAKNLDNMYNKLI